ncbi:MAG: recombinase family protein [Erythrobacter sp.]
MTGELSRIRCGIYTRKSTDHRLDDETNSLVMQREICSAYIQSQRYKNWIEIPDCYDDGGHSGSGLERPALAQLMQDIEVGRIDTIVVYKIDRLTRSLADFVRLMELFDRRKIALVSVSQAFDTSDSMGRMILNILLTFAQFERELIAERIKDSIQTRKRHGKIHGGPVPLGYVRTDDGIEVDQAEAEIVQFIFDKYLEVRRYTPVITAVQEAGMRRSIKKTNKGEERGGTIVTGSQVYSILRNPAYIGEIRGRDKNYPARHKPIIERKTWEAAQILRAERKRRGPHPKRTEHFLAGLLWDDLGRHMKLEIYKTRKQRHAAYVSSNAAWSIKEFRRSYRCKAKELDTSVVAILSEFLGNRGKLRRALRELGVCTTHARY